MITHESQESQVIDTTYYNKKHFPFSVTLEEETHDMEIIIFFEESLTSGEKNLDKIKIENNELFRGECTDLGEQIQTCLESWFNDVFPEITYEETEGDYDNMFSIVWEYLEENDLT